MIRNLLKDLCAALPFSFGSRTRLIQSIQRAHRGEISIEELVAGKIARGRYAPLIAAVSDILLDLKQQQAERAILEQEIRDRIANRTHALERKVGSLQLQAARDALTGLGNRRALDLDLQKVVETCQTAGEDACLLMIDVDHFKLLNDTLGHAAGDQLLREIGQLTRSNLRDNDHAYRAGGDEFVIIMQCANLPAGTALASRLCSLVTALTRSLAVSLPPQLSIGVCALSELKERTSQQLLHTADTRLYAVKALRPRTRRSA